MTHQQRRALAEQLHVEAMKSLLQRMRKGAPGVEVVQTCRLFLADQGVFAEKLGPDEARALKRLRKLYLRRLYEAIERPDPPASLLKEVRFLLEAREGALEEALRGTSTGADTGPQAQAMPFLPDPPKGVQ